jgi:hypothetical protein
MTDLPERYAARSRQVSFRGMTYINATFKDDSVHGETAFRVERHSNAII